MEMKELPRLSGGMLQPLDVTHPAVDISLGWDESLWSCLPRSFGDRRSLKRDLSIQSWAQGLPRPCVVAGSSSESSSSSRDPGASTRPWWGPQQGDHLGEKRQHSLVCSEGCEGEQPWRQCPAYWAPGRKGPGWGICPKEERAGWSPSLLCVGLSILSPPP